MKKSVKRDKSKRKKVNLWIVFAIIVLIVLIIILGILFVRLTGRVLDENLFGTQSTPGNINTCQTLDTSGVYNLNASFGTGGTCIIVNANNVVINGNGYTVTGNIDSTNIAGGYSFTLNNTNVIGNVYSNGYDNIMPECHGDFGDNPPEKGFCNILSSQTACQHVGCDWGMCVGAGMPNCGIYDSSPSDCNKAYGPGGQLCYYDEDRGVCFVNNDCSGAYRSSDCASASALGCTWADDHPSSYCSGGAITNCNQFSLETCPDGTTGWGTSSGICTRQSNNAGNIDITNSNITGNIYSYGGGNVDIGGNGGNIKLINSFINSTSVININFAIGGNSGNQGTINLTNSGFYNNYGKIQFFNVYTSQSYVPGILNISNNSAVVNSASYNDYNKSANITLYNLPSTTNYINQKIFRNGFECNLTTNPRCYNFTALTASTVVFNVSSWTNYSIYRGNYVSPPDNTPPVVNLTYPLNTTYNTNVSAINYTASDNVALSRCWYSNNSGVWNSSSVVGGINFTNVNSIEGSNTWRVYCNDTSGNINSSSVVFYKDTITPVIRLISPADSYSTNSTLLTFSFNVTDSSAVNCSLILDGNIINFNSSANVSGGINYFVNSSSIGSHGWSVNCTDLANNIGNSSTMVLIITTPSDNGTTTTPRTITSVTGSSVPTTSGLGGNKRIYDYDVGKIVRNVNYNLDTPVNQINLIQILTDGNNVREDHYVEVKEVNAHSIVVEIRSNPINVTFKIGDEKKFDLNNDNFYDLYIKLNSIINKRANLTVRNIHEELSTIDKTRVEQNRTFVEDGSYINNTEQNNETPSGINIIDSIKNNWKYFLMFVIIALIVILVIVFYIVKMDSRRREIIKLRKRR